MKIKPEHLEHMKSAIEQLLVNSGGAEYVVQRYESGQFPRADVVKDLQKRFCFDLLYSAGLTSFVCGTIYSYANDNHLYTALKSICPKVERKY